MNMKKGESQRDMFRRLLGLSKNTLKEFDYSRDELDHASREELGQVMQIKVKKERLRKELYNAIDPLTKHIYKDDNWRSVNKVKQAMADVCEKYKADLTFNAGTYENMGQSNPYKRWMFSIDFTNQNDIPDKIEGNVVAHAAGSVMDPFDRYDVTVTM